MATFADVAECYTITMCEWCNNPLTRTKQKKFCSPKCKRAAYQQRKRDAIVKLRNEYKKGLVCVDCGENHPATLDFHHLDPSTKRYRIASAITRATNWDKVLAEIEKCIVLCSNCHRKRHYEGV